MITKLFWFLRLGPDTLDDVLKFRTKAAAVDHYREVAEELSRFDQGIEASLHRASSRQAVEEYPDFVLCLGPRGGVQLQAG